MLQNGAKNVLASNFSKFYLESQASHVRNETISSAQKKQYCI